ncbi:MAG: hypothetical protein JO266_15305 [Acidobacteria bacterium]|nr:hypothetical protein [Acidobacteriota bacterium]
MVKSCFARHCNLPSRPGEFFYAEYSRAAPPMRLNSETLRWNRFSKGIQRLVEEINNR